MGAVNVMAGKGIEGSLRRAKISQQLTLYIPAAVLALLVLAAIFAPFLAPYSPTKTALGQRLIPPFFIEGGSTARLRGTDTLGRGILRRVIFRPWVSRPR